MTTVGAHRCPRSVAFLIFGLGVSSLLTQSYAYYVISRYQPSGYSLRLEPDIDSFEASVLLPTEPDRSSNQDADLDEEQDQGMGLGLGLSRRQMNGLSPDQGDKPRPPADVEPMRGDLAAGLAAAMHFQKKRSAMIFAVAWPPIATNTAAPERHTITTERKRSAESAKPLPETEHVCEMNIRNDYQPKFGHERNGTRVEIQQDDRRQFRATFVECVNTKRDSCHGIDKLMFTSECVTVYEFRPARIRVENSPSDFFEGFVKVPIACQCRLRRKVNRILIE